MSGNNLSVKITADVTELQTKFAVARAEVAALSAEMNKLAKASAQGIIDPAGAARLQQVAGDFAAAKVQAASLGAALGQATSGVLGMSKSLGESHGSIATATREFRALFDELSSGRTRQTPGTIAILLQRVVGLGPAALGAVGAVAALAGGLGYLAYRALEASKALDSTKLGAEFSGNMDITREQIAQLTAELSKAQNIWQSDAQKIIANFARIPEATTPEIQALEHLIADFARLTGEDADKASENLAKLFNPKTSATEFAKSFYGIAQAQRNEAAAADLSGNANAIAAAKLQIVGSVTERSTASIVKQTASLNNWKNWWDALVLSGFSASRWEEAHVKIVERATAVENANIAALKQKIAETAALAQSPEQKLKVGVDAAEKENPITKQLRDLRAGAENMREALKTATDPNNVADLNAALQQTNEKIQALQFGPVFERMRQEIEKVAATWDGTQTGMLQKQIQVAQQTLASVTNNAKARVEIETEIDKLTAHLREATGVEAIANAKEQVSAIGTAERLGAVQRLESERDIWQQLLAGSSLNAAQRIEVQRSLNQTLSGIVREGAKEQATIARQDATADIAISRLRLEAAKSEIDLTAAADSAAVAAKLARLRELTAEEFRLDNDALENELRGLQEGTAAYDAAYNQIRELKARLVVDLAKLDREAAQANNKEAKEQISAWKGAVNEIEGSESGLVSDLLNKRKTLAQSLLSISADLITKEIANDLRGITTRLLLEESAQTKQKALEQGGFLYHLLFQNQKTAATVQAQAAQTSAVTSGQTAQNTAQAAGVAEGRALQASAGPAQVLADAAEAFAGAYAATAAIPYIGPELAPGVAAEAYAAVASMAGAASFAVGTNYVPRDMMANIHEGEAIVPKAYNPAAGGSAPGGLGGGDTHVHLSLSAFDASGLDSLIHSQRFRDGIAKSMSKYVNRGGRG